MWEAKRTLALTALLALLLTGCAKSQTLAADTIYHPETGAGASAANYETYTLQPVDVSKDSELSMVPSYDTQVQLTAREALVFQEYLVSRNQSVAAGEPVARFTRNASRADVEEASLALLRAQEAFTQQQEALQAAVDAAQGEPQAQLAQLDLEQYAYTAQQELAALQEALETAQARLEDVYYYAPFDAVVGSVTNYSQGSKVAAGDSLLTLYKADSLILSATSNTDFFQYNMDVTVEYGKANSKKTATGRVVATDRVLGAYQPAMAVVYVKLDDPSLTAEALENAVVKVTTQQLKGVLAVPKSAVETQNGVSYVYVLEGDTVQKRFIQKGVTVGTVGSYQVQVLSGLTAGQQIVLN